MSFEPRDSSIPLTGEGSDPSGLQCVTAEHACGLQFDGGKADWSTWRTTTAANQVGQSCQEGKKTLHPPKVSPKGTGSFFDRGIPKLTLALYFARKFPQNGRAFKKWRDTHISVHLLAAVRVKKLSKVQQLMERGQFGMRLAALVFKRPKRGNSFRGGVLVYLVWYKQPGRTYCMLYACNYFCCVLFGFLWPGKTGLPKILWVSFRVCSTFWGFLAMLFLTPMFFCLEGIPSGRFRNFRNNNTYNCNINML